MKLRTKLGITLVVALAVPIALAAEWATDDESINAVPYGAAITTGTAPASTGTHERLTDDLKIYASF